jgi:geranylgeranyl reductase family protein
MQCEVVIIGAGPAGAISAQRLSSSGVKVILIDQAVFPRDKTCGDLVTREGLEVLERSGLTTWSQQFHIVKKMRFTSPNNQLLEVPVNREDKTVARIIPRRQLDNKLVENAVSSGTLLKEGVRVQQIDTTQPKLRVSLESGLVEAELLILADGSHAPITRKLGLAQPGKDLLAIQQYLAGDIEPQGPIEFHFQSNIIPGYTWMFPMGDGLINIGAGTYTHRVTARQVDLKFVLESFKNNHPVQKTRLANTEAVRGMRSHPLRTDLGSTRTHAARILVTGDAAGLVSPFTGEGIASAMRSGELAAQTALSAFKIGDLSQSSLQPYTRSLHSRYGSDKRIARLLRSVLKHPVLLNRVFKKMIQSPELAYLFGQIFLDESSPKELVKPTNLLRLLI